jgi:putative oxidoreductase
MAAFFTAFAPTGYLTFVKVLELLGGVLIAIPVTRRAGLLILGPIMVNILAFHVFVTAGQGLLDPPLLILTALMLFLTWAERAEFLAFLRPTAR